MTIIVFYTILAAAYAAAYWQIRREERRDHARIIRAALQAELDAIIEDYHCDKWDAEVSGR